MALDRAVVSVGPAEVADLRSRLQLTRWPQPWPRPRLTDPADLVEYADPTKDDGVLRRLVVKWADDYAWSVYQERINSLPSYRTQVGGEAVHFLKFDAESQDALPIIVTHGWPSSFLEMVELAQRLSEPSRHGGDPRDSFTVIVPSLPGFGLSPQRPALPSDLATHELWHRLMHDELGFVRYGAHGGDLGAGVASRLAEAHPESVVGVHLLAVADPVDQDPASLSVDERLYLASVQRWFAEDGGYEHEQMTRPLTLSYGLSDSPVALLAWILEKHREWSDCGGDVSRCFSDDYLLTAASLYWFTNSISTSFRPYFEHAQGWTGRVQRVEVPTAVALFPKDLVQPPRSWAERTYNVTRFTQMPRGGHFAAHEQPELLAQDLTQFFRDLTRVRAG